MQLLIDCNTWPLLYLLTGALMWLFGWLFGRSGMSKYKTEIEGLTGDNKSLTDKNVQLEKDVKIIKSDYDRTNSSLISAKNSLTESNNKYNTTLSKYRMLETERSNIQSQRDKLLAAQKEWEIDKAKLQENSLEAADANISNKAIADLKAKLAETDRELAACKASKVKEDKVSFVAPPPPAPPMGENAKINQLVSSNEPRPTNTPKSVSSSGQSGMGAHFKNTNLQILEGVGPKIESILKDAGYTTWDAIANASDADLQKVLDDAGPRYRMHNASDWSTQSKFAANGQWDKLVQYQKDMDGDASEPNSKAEKLFFKAMGFAAAKPSDLKVVEGIGPKIESLLKNAGIQNWSMLASSSVSRIQDILTAAGDRYRLADPGTWPKQAELANQGKWTELKEYQDFLSGGKA